MFRLKHGGEIMDGEILAGIRGLLDAELKKAAPVVGVAFGTVLFAEFQKRGWFTLETFGVGGTGLFAARAPAYQGHFAYLTWDIAEDAYKVGKHA
jgi:hypothetical protein